jgi:spore maturation protein SpmA
MLNHKAFGVVLMGLGIAVVAAYFVILSINAMWATIIAVSIIVSMAGIMFFWLGFKVITSSQVSKEADKRSEEV